MQRKGGKKDKKQGKDLDKDVEEKERERGECTEKDKD
jgi:hypothetical protein